MEGVGTYFLNVIRTNRGMLNKLIMPEDKGALVATPHLYTPEVRQRWKEPERRQSLLGD